MSAEAAARLELVPITLREAHAFVLEHHRHLGPSVGGLFALGIARGERIVAVAVVGRPVARRLDDGWTVEVNRLASDGTEHAPSKLYRACWRAARALGYRRLITYTLPSEGGSSLRAAGLRLIGTSERGGSWDVPSRPRVDTSPRQQRLRWELP
jgi:hypothetical protein